MKLHKLVLLAVFSLSMALTSRAALVYVGSWNINDGPHWGSNPLAYSATGAAQLLFGAGTYQISTVDNQVANINNMAYYNVIGYGNHIFGESFFRGVEGVTHYQDNYTGNLNTATVSAYVSDLFSFEYPNSTTINHAFRVEGVPDAGSTISLLGAGLVLFAMIRRRLSL